MLDQQLDEERRQLEKEAMRRDLAAATIEEDVSMETLPSPMSHQDRARLNCPRLLLAEEAPERGAPAHLQGRTHEPVHFGREIQIRLVRVEVNGI